MLLLFVVTHASAVEMGEEGFDMVMSNALAEAIYNEGHECDNVMKYTTTPWKQFVYYYAVCSTGVDYLVRFDGDTHTTIVKPRALMRDKGETAICGAVR